MEKDFDFKQIGKKMPYQVPEGFFEKNQQVIMARVGAEMQRKKIYHIKLVVATVLSVAAMIVGFLFFVGLTVEDNTYKFDTHLIVEAPVSNPIDFETSLQQIPDDYLEEFVDMMEYDVFLKDN